MKRYVQLLERLDPDQTLVKPVAKIAVLLSGQSDFLHSELSEEQKELLGLFKVSSFMVIDMGFPYYQSHAYQGCNRATAGVASVRNIQQFLYSLTSDDYRRLIAKHLQPVFKGSNDLVIVCQSLGLNMIKVALPFLNINSGANITLLALGPVVWGRFRDQRFKLIVVKGLADWVSIIFDRQPVDYWISCQHMDYCRNGQVREIVRRTLSNQNQS